MALVRSAYAAGFALFFAVACSDEGGVESGRGVGGAPAGGASGASGVGGIAGGGFMGGAAGALEGGTSGMAGASSGGSAGAAGSSTGGAAGSSTGGAGGAGAGGDSGTPTQDPCVGEPNGPWCGATIGGEGGHLYTCASGVTTSNKTCANGCFKADAAHTCAAKCCSAKPPGYTVANGVWNACPFNAGVSGREHMAIDYAGDKGNPIPASMDGTIWYIRNKGEPNCYKNGTCTDACKATGSTIVLKAACGDPLKPGNDLFLRYHHINDVAAGIKVGSKVARGTTIAKVGDSGCATAPHIHFQMATHPKGKYALGTLPSFYDCATTKDPTTRLCSTLSP